MATKHQGITYGGNLRVPLGVSEMPVNFEAGGGLHVYTDSSWGNSAKPFGGYIIMLHNGPVDWSSKKLRIVADSTCEAETATASRAVKPLLFIRELLNTMGVPTRGATLFMVENQAMMQMVQKEGMTSRTRYFERATLCLFVKEAYVKGVVDLVLVSTVEEVADIFTKALDATTFNKMKAYIFNVADKVMAERGMKLLGKLQSAVRMFQG